jgi:putative surface-exposed virulence protein
MKNITQQYRLTILLFSILISFSIQSQTVIDSENFEAGWGIWNDGGSDCTRTNSSTPNNTYSIDLQDNSGGASAMTTNDIDLTSYGSVDLSLDFEAVSMDKGEDFWILYSDDGGSNWNTIATYKRGVNLSNGIAYSETISINTNSYTFSTNSRFRIQCDASDDGDDVYIDNVSITGYPPAPEIDVEGNNISITNGDLTPSFLDYTNFGIANSGITITRTFTIKNDGTVNLTIANISLSNSTDFSITGTPFSTPIISGGNTTFTITYNALTINTKTSTITITNNDSDESSYQFDIQAGSEENFFDSDGDGIFDNVDIDDDNDGILDTEEELACNNSTISITTNYKFLNENFGSGNRTTINTTYNATTTYCYENGTNGTATTECPSLNNDDLSDGEYTVYYKAGNGDGTDQTPTAEVASWADAYWYTGEDHTTGDVNGRMAMFNADYDPGTFYTATISGALPNIPITYSFWVLNLDTNTAPGIATRLRPDILVEFRDINNNVLASITTGDIPPSINGNAAGSWYNFTANLTFNVSEFYVYFINNEVGGAGNDLAIDDIVISQTLCDTDDDGVADVFDLDSDNDGIPDIVEAGLGDFSEGKATLTGIGSWVDANANGMHDAIEGHVTLDSDGDGTPNYLDLDSDNDTIFDVDESGAGNSGDSNYQNGDGDITGDGVGDGSDTDIVRETDVDSDGTSEYFTDGILDIYDFYTGGTFNTAYGNSNQGLGYTYYVKDTDNDGVPDYIDITSDGSTYDISSTLYASLDANNDGVIDDTNDAEGDGIVDLFDTNDNVFGSPRDLDRKLDLFFDGRNDYAEDVSVINGWGEATLMTWIKIDPSASGNQIIIGQDEFYLQLNADKSITAYADGNTISNGSPLTTNQWIHLAATYSISDKKFKLYINGLAISSKDISSALNLDTSSFTIGRQPNTDSNYFNGYIDEVRVFSKALSDDELHKMIYQEIEDNSGITKGSTIPKDITDFIDTSNITPLSWSSLERYFRMDTYKDDIIDDLTTSSIDTGTGAKIYNTKLINVQTAPLPFITQQSGSLPNAVNNPGNGVNGQDVIVYNWSIVQIAHNNVTYNATQKHVGLIVNQKDASLNPIEFSIENDSELNVSWYLKLDGKIDLDGESQLVQGGDSTLDVTSSGVIERDQQGTADLYTYNYWAAPVGISNTTSNNNSYTLPDVLNDGTNPATPVPVNFLTSGYNGTSGVPIGIADYWIWKYDNQLDDDYASWQQVRSTGSLVPGEGYTMKGTTDTGGAISTEQNYVFNGKPNNADITLTLSTGNDYLVGNPYASAIDADEFILDNISDGSGRAASNIINGALYFWEHFASSTHNLAEYEGGYGTYTLMGGTTAISTDTRINATGVSGTKTPQRYIPVGQGFFVAADTGGLVTFKNSQRIFKTETSDPSVFMRSNTGKSASTSKITNAEIMDIRPKIRIMLDSPKGYHRQLLLGADENASTNFDKGYDALLIEDNKEDIFWTFDGKKCVIQATNNFNDNNVFPLGVIINQAGMTTIKIDTLENIPESVDIFVYDKELNIFHDLNLYPYNINLPIGEHLNKFEIVLHNKSLSIEDNTLTDIDIHYSNAIKSIIIKNPTYKSINLIRMTNLLGQEVFTTKDYGSKNYYEIKTKQFSSGTYILTVVTDKGIAVKKVIVD